MLDSDLEKFSLSTDMRFYWDCRECYGCVPKKEDEAVRMKREGLTFTMVFLAESANYGEGIGNITTLEKNDAWKLRTVLLYFQTGHAL